MRKLTSGLMIAGAALFVAACGGGAANNTANAPAVDNGTMMSNDTMAPDMNAPMPAGNSAMNSTTTTTTAPGGNTTTTTTNTATANHM
jgi:hypothetical protein